MKYSIITINYNNCEGLRRTIESVARQTYRNYEFIVIDGASTDGSGEVLKQYDNAITYWVSEPDKGIYNAMNKGIARATGDYLNFMNSGDCFYADDVLERVASHTSDADIIVGRDYHFSATKQQGHASIQPPRLSMLTFFVSTLDHQSSFIRRSLFDGCPYREDFRLVSDWIFFTEQVVDHERRVEFIPNIICRREEGGLSEKQRERNRTEIDRYLHERLSPGIYADYSTLSRLDKTTLYRLFGILDNPQKRRWLIRCIKLITRFYD